MTIPHPYEPEVLWRIAVSRRFSSAAADTLYRSVIFPAISSEGSVLECFRASNNPEEMNFWTNRMKLLFELSDIHILLDVDTNAHVAHEFDQSRRITRRSGHISALGSNFGWNPMTVPSLFAPVSITITTRLVNDRFNKRRRNAIVCYRAADKESDFLSRLKNQIYLAKQVRTQSIQRAERHNKLLGRLVDAMGKADKAPVANIRTVLKDVMRLWLELSTVVPVQIIQSNVSLAYSKAKDMTQPQFLHWNNELANWLLQIRRGEIQLPLRLSARYKQMRMQVNEKIAPILGTNATHSGPLSWLISLVVFIAAIGVPRLTKQRL
jgi:hypothetical protein